MPMHACSPCCIELTFCQRQQEAEAFLMFCVFYLILFLCCFMKARGAAESIVATVALMAESGLPCYGRGRPLANLRRRFRLDLPDPAAAAFMRATIADAYDKVRWPPSCLCTVTCLLSPDVDIARLLTSAAGTCWIWSEANGGTGLRLSVWTSDCKTITEDTDSW